MTAIKKLFNFYIKASIHVALAVVSLAVVTSLHFEKPVSEFLLLFIFFGSITGYNFVKFASITGLHHRSLTKRLKILQIFTGFSLVVCVLAAFFVRKEVFFWSILFGILTLLYALPVFRKRQNLRSISGIKIFVIALVWSGVTVLLPLIPLKNGIFDTLFLEFLQRFLLVLVLILPFEIRDLNYDQVHLGTLPQRIGILKTKILGMTLLLGVIAIEFLKESAALASVLAIITVCLVTSVLVWLSKEKQNAYFSAFWVEGIPVLWLVLLLIFRSI